MSVQPLCNTYNEIVVLLNKRYKYFKKFYKIHILISAPIKVNNTFP